MNMLILDEAAQESLEHLNATGDPALKLIPIPLLNGEAALTTGLLADCANGDTWDHYGEFLEGLPEADVAPEMIDEPPVI